MRRALLTAAAIAAVGAFAFAVASVIEDSSAQKEYESLVAACERGNVIREQVNESGVVLTDFLLSAARARSSAARLGSGRQAKVDADTAAKYRRLTQRIVPIEIARCADEFPRP